MSIRINTFEGEQPRLSRGLLPVSKASLAVNCNLSSGALKPLAAPLLAADIAVVAPTVFKHKDDGWLGFKAGASVVKSAVIDVSFEKPLGHLLITGERNYPIQYFCGGLIVRLGLPRPALKLNNNICTSGKYKIFGFGVAENGAFPAAYGQAELVNIEDTNVKTDPTTLADYAGLPNSNPGQTDRKLLRSSSYCYTYVRKMFDGIIGQESAPSPPTEIINVYQGEGVALSGFVLSGLEAVNITHIRIYRTVAGLESSEFHFLAELELAKINNLGGYIYEDEVLDKNISPELLATSLWDMIPNDAKGLIKTNNGMYAAFRGNELLISEPFVPYAFPEAYRLTVEDDIVALAHIDNTIVVLTEGRPYLAQGSVPESLQLMQVPIEQACISKGSVATLAGGVIYASPDGLMYFSQNEQQLLTAGILNKEEWEKFKPETLEAVFFENQYIAFSRGTNLGFIFDFERKDLIRLELDVPLKVRGLYLHSLDDALYLAVFNAAKTDIYKFKSAESFLPFTWWSKEFFTSVLFSFNSLRLEGEDRNGTQTTAYIYGKNRAKPRATMRVKYNKTVKLPQLRSERVWSIKLCGQTPVYELALGGNVEVVENGG